MNKLLILFFAILGTNIMGAQTFNFECRDHLPNSNVYAPVGLIGGEDIRVIYTEGASKYLWLSEAKVKVDPLLTSLDSLYARSWTPPVDHIVHELSDGGIIIDYPNADPVVLKKVFDNIVFSETRSNVRSVGLTLGSPAENVTNITHEYGSDNYLSDNELIDTAADLQLGYWSNPLYNELRYTDDLTKYYEMFIRDILARHPEILSDEFRSRWIVNIDGPKSYVINDISDIGAYAHVNLNCNTDGFNVVWDLNLWKREKPIYDKYNNRISITWHEFGHAIFRDSHLCHESHIMTGVYPVSILPTGANPPWWDITNVTCPEFGSLEDGFLLRRVQNLSWDNPKPTNSINRAFDDFFGSMGERVWRASLCDIVGPSGKGNLPQGVVIEKDGSITIYN